MRNFPSDRCTHRLMEMLACGCSVLICGGRLPWNAGRTPMMPRGRVRLKMNLLHVISISISMVSQNACNSQSI
jgi:hypothetical protein